MQFMSRVIVGMSGGVDSAVTAYLLKMAGYDVIGVTLKIWLSENGRESRCCEIEDARRTAEVLEIPYYAVNCVSEFREKVTKPFLEQYLCGRTPNPCVGCNREIKWKQMMDCAQTMGAEYIATGHYASILQLPDGRYTVKKADCVKKDQTYMLYRLSQEQLRRTLLPLGKLSKEEVRRIAVGAGLPIAEKKDSQELCFVTEGEYGEFVEMNAAPDGPIPGDFKDEAGNILGRHRGIYYYTVGQRKGLGVSLGYPVYVKRILAETNEVILGREEELYSTELLCVDLHFMGMKEMAPGEVRKAVVKIRYHHEGQEAELQMLEDGKMLVRFQKSVRAAAPGQAAVFYSEDGWVLGGGTITI